MKKQYMKPSTQLTKVGVHQMICGTNSTPQVAVDRNATAIDAGSVESRCGGSLWDDDEE